MARGRRSRASARGPRVPRVPRAALVIGLLLAGLLALYSLRLRSRRTNGDAQAPAVQAGSTAPVSTRPIPIPQHLDEALPALRVLLRQTRQAVELKPGSDEAWGRYGNVLDANRLYPEALEAYRAAAELNPRAFHWAYLEAIMLDFTAAPVEELDPAFRRALALNPNFPPAFLRYGLALVRHGQLEEAVEAFEKALVLDPSFAWAHRSLGQTLISLGELDSAVEHLETAASLSPGDAGARSALATAYHQLGRSEEAAAASTAAAGLEPELSIPDPIRYRVEQDSRLPADVQARALGLLARREYPAALASFELLASLEPERAATLARLGVCLAQLGRMDEARDRLERAIVLDPALVSARWQLAEIHSSRRAFAAAADEYRAILEAMPDEPGARIALASSLARAGELEPALAEFERVAAAGGREADAAFQHEWGTALMNAGRFAEAEICLGRAVEAAPESPSLPNTLYNRGLVLLELGRREEAVTSLELAAEIAPTHPAARRLVQLRAEDRREE